MDTCLRDRQSRSRQLCLVALAMGAALYFPSPTHAQGQPVDADGFAVVSQAQRELNVEGIRLLSAGDPEKAIRLFRSSLDLDELNVTYLNLGRALAKVGQCDDAVQAYDKVAESPAVRAPSREEVAQALEAYRAELKTQCPGELVVECAGPAFELSVDDGEPFLCDGKPLMLPAGIHALAARGAGGALSFDVQVEGMGHSKVRVEQEAGDTPLAATPVPVPPTPVEESGLATAGWVVAASGAGLLAASLAIDFMVLQPLHDEWERAGAVDDKPTQDRLEGPLSDGQLANTVVIGVGAAALVTGVTLLIIDGVSSDGENATEDEQAVEAALAPWVGVDGGGAALRVRF